MSHFSQLLTFIEVANTQSFAEASRQLSLSTSTVSARVKALENKLKVRLFNRNTRTVTLTDEGDLYFSQCQSILKQLINLEDTLTQKGQLSGRIKLTVPLDLPAKPLTHIISDFLAHHSEINIEIIATDEPLDLVSNNIDIALRGGKLTTLSLISRKIGEGELAFITSQEYYDAKLADRQDIRIEELPIIDPLNILPTIADGRLFFKNAIATSNMSLAKELLIQSSGIGILPKNICLKEFENKQLIEVDSGFELPKLPLYILYPSRDHLSLRVRKFIDFIIKSQDKYSLV